MARLKRPYAAQGLECAAAILIKWHGLRDYSDHYPFFSSLFADIDMPINLPPITQQLIRSVEHGRQEQIAALTKVLGIAVGNTTLASVEKVEPINAQQRDELLKRTQEALQQLTRSPATPAVKTQITQLMEQQKLLSSADVKWVHLQVNGRPLLTYTDRPLVAGQQVPLQLTTAQRLVMTDPLPGVKPGELLAPLTNNARMPVSPAPVSTTQLTPGAGASVPAIAPKPGGEIGGRQQIESQLAAALRNLLPQKDQPHQLYGALPSLQQAAIGNRTELLSSSLQQALKTLADHLRSPAQLSNPKLLPMTLKNSGIFFEHKLGTALPVAGAKALPPSDKSVLTNQLTAQDLKGALLQVHHRATQDLAVAAKSAEAARAVSGMPPPTSLALPQNLPASLSAVLQLLQQMPFRTLPELSRKVLQAQLLMLIQQQALSSLAKIQLQQVHSLNHQQGQTEAAQPSQSWLFDVPVRHGQDIHNLELRIQQDWVDDKPQDNEKDDGDKKVRQWTVTMSFKLPEAGGFHAQLSVINESVSARLWAEREDTVNEVLMKLSELRQQLETRGVSVKQLQCVQGVPPGEAMSLQYSLVDVTT